jgi:endonuclease/exonuclease/phosphatase family metal-dependent hydrolase
MHRLVVLFLVFASFALQAQTIKVMTYNIRYDNPGDGPNQWGNRKDKVADVIKKYKPDIFGVQEALYHQLQDLSERLTDYEYFGVGRDDGKQKGEFSAIFVRKDRFKVLDKNTFWLSTTPDVPGSKDWDAAITRVATWAKLRDRQSKKDFVYMNTHFDHRGKEARKNSAMLLKQRAAELGKKYPLVITGDFNITREAPPYAIMMDPSPIKLLDPAPEGGIGTFCGFTVNARRCVGIDYIFSTTQWKSSGYQVISDNDGTYYPSDHLPVMVTLSIPK